MFTNLGTDHLDLHGTPEAYFRAKARLFTPEMAAIGVSNADDTHGRLLLDAAPVEMVAYSLADATDLVVGADHHELTWRGVRLVVGLGGRFNVANTLAAATTAAVLGIAPDVATLTLADLADVVVTYLGKPGRRSVDATVAGPDEPVDDRTPRERHAETLLADQLGATPVDQVAAS